MCEQCGNAYQTSHYLANHIRYSHLGIKHYLQVKERERKRKEAEEKSTAEETKENGNIIPDEQRPAPAPMLTLESGSAAVNMNNEPSALPSLVLVTSDNC
jgi:hypothetical protein